MKLEKVTAKPGRRYHDACGAAHGLDLIGERWALLVVRELMLGPRRFGDLKKDLHGISANVLTQRLEGLEGSGVVHGMRADRGAIEEVWIDGRNHEPTFRVIGKGPPRGICGSGLISLVAEMFLTGILDKGGHFVESLASPRIRRGSHGAEYVVAWREEAANDDGDDITITAVDIDNLLRAKAAVYAGFNVLADRVGVELDSVERVLIGGSFGKYINVEKAVGIGLLPDLPWERFEFLGNTSVKGAYLSLLDRERRAEVAGIASAMTYIELSADNSFYEAFTSALFLPHTDLSRFPSVEASIT